MNSSPIESQNALLQNNFVHQTSTQIQTLKPNDDNSNKHSNSLKPQSPSFDCLDDKYLTPEIASTSICINPITTNSISISTYPTISTSINTTTTTTTTEHFNSVGLINNFNSININTPETDSTNSTAIYSNDNNYNNYNDNDSANNDYSEQRGSIISSRGERIQKSRIVIRKFQKLDPSELSSTPAPDVKIGQRIAYKEYYGNEFGTIRWIG